VSLQARSSCPKRRPFPWLSVVAFSLALAWPPTTLIAQTPLRIGDRVRVMGFSRHVGEVHNLSADTLFVVSSDGMVSPVPWSEMSRLQVSLGKRRNTLRGALWGFAAAAAVSTILGIAGNPADRDNTPDWAAVLIFTGLSGLPSAGIGALIGRFVWSERWREVSLPVVQPSVVALPGGRIGVGVRYRH